MQRGAYDRIISAIFDAHFTVGTTSICFPREEIEETAEKLGIPRPKNLGDVVYSYKYRKQLPETIRQTEDAGHEWVIKSEGQSRYVFQLVERFDLRPDPGLGPTKIPDATPGIVARYCLSDEQALLARLRYNRLVDIFTGITCYSLQNHLRTSVVGIGQIETDEIYLGIDRRGAQYVFPVQAKGGKDKLAAVQIEQDIAMCREKFPELICRPITSQFIDDDLVALFEIEEGSEERLVKASERHYRLVPPDEIDASDLRQYRERLDH